MKKIFIAGCARSGTTLTQALMWNFADSVVHPEEASVDQFAKFDPNDSVAVVKRTWKCHLTLHDLPEDVGLIYCVRHPFDVLTSVHPQTASERRFHVTPERWTAEYLALRTLRDVQQDRRICLSRYEDLVAHPDAAQQRIGEFFNLTPTRRFSETTIHKSSIEKWKRSRELREYIRSLPEEFLELVREFCIEFGYKGSVPRRSPRDLLAGLLERFGRPTTLSSTRAIPLQWHSHVRPSQIAIRT